VTPSDRGEYELPDAFDLLAYAGHRVEYTETEGWRVNVNTQEDREQAERYLVQSQEQPPAGTD
jgi:glucose-1-phosphate thymidylyltransferase